MPYIFNTNSLASLHYCVNKITWADMLLY